MKFTQYEPNWWTNPIKEGVSKFRLAWIKLGIRLKIVKGFVRG